MVDGSRIALESEGDQIQAKEAYNHAMNGDSLSPDLKAFIQARISSI